MRLHGIATIIGVILMGTREIQITTSKLRLLQFIHVFDKLMFQRRESWPHYILRRDKVKFLEKYGQS